MRQSQLFTKTRKESPKDEVSKNAELLIRGGFIDKLMAGVYSYLPLGLKVLEKINTIIREEMDAIGGQELLMPALHPKELWEKTGRVQKWAEMILRKFYIEENINGNAKLKEMIERINKLDRIMNEKIYFKIGETSGNWLQAA